MGPGISENDKHPHIVGPRLNCLILVLQKMRSNNTERLVEFHNGEPGYYLKRGYESY